MRINRLGTLSQLRSRVCMRIIFILNSKLNIVVVKLVIVIRGFRGCKWRRRLRFFSKMLLAYDKLVAYR